MTALLKTFEKHLSLKESATEIRTGLLNQNSESMLNNSHLASISNLIE